MGLTFATSGTASSLPAKPGPIKEAAEDDDRNGGVELTPHPIRKQNSSDVDGYTWHDEEDDGGGTLVGDDPHAVPSGGDLTSARLGVFKGMVGPAILYLPHGFAVSGYLIAVGIIAIATAMYLHSSRCLLEAWKLQTQRQHVVLESHVSHGETRAVKALSYSGLAKVAFGHTGEVVVQTGIALMQSGVCLTYLIFVPHNLHTSMAYLTSDTVYWSPAAWLVIMVALEIPLSWITDIRRLAVTNLLANLCIFYGLALCLLFAFGAAMSVTVAPDNDDSSTSSSPSIKPHHLAPVESQWFLFVGTSVLLFEGSITLLVPLQESVTHPQDREHFPQAYYRVILSIIFFYIFFGITCWSAFGDDVSVVLTTSLPRGRWATSVQLAYSVAVFFTYPFQNFPALQVATPTIAHKLLEQRLGLPRGHFLTHRNVISSFLVICMALIAVMTMNSLDKVVSLMGSLLGCPIAFCVPPLIHNELVESSPSRQAVNRIVAGAGLVAMLLASAATILTW